MFKKDTLFIALILTACVTAPDPPPIPTSTPIPLDQLTFNGGFIQANTLGGLSTGLITRSSPTIFTLRDIPAGINDYHLEVTLFTGEHVGWVSIFIYNTPEQIYTAYKIASTNATGSLDYSPGNVGDLSTQFRDAILGGIVFSRCTTLVVISLKTYIDVQTIQPYAENLDHKLIPIICQK